MAVEFFHSPPSPFHLFLPRERNLRQFLPFTRRNILVHFSISRCTVLFDFSNYYLFLPSNGRPLFPSPSFLLPPHLRSSPARRGLRVSYSVPCLLRIACGVSEIGRGAGASRVTVSGFTRLLPCQRLKVVGATPWVPLAPDHAFQAAQEARQEDHVSRRPTVQMREMDALAGYGALVLLALHCVVTGCSAVNLEGSALLKFKTRVEEDPHGAMANWSPWDDDPCTWNGVRCTDGRVVMLNLKDLSLRGTLSSELGCLSHLQAIVLSNNLFGGVIPKEIGGLTTLEVLDLSNNNLTGRVPQEIAEMPSLKHLLLSNNRFQWPVIQNPYNGFESGSSTEENIKDTSNLAARLPTQFAATNPASQLSRRRLLQDSNLAAPPSPNAPIPAVVPVPSTGSGSFSALSPIKAPAPSVNPQISPPTSSGTPSEAGSKGRSMKWLYAIVIPSVALLLVVIACFLLLCRSKSVATIGPWKTGLSGQLQKAFVTGVPKLQRSELEGACEDFSNIVATYPHYTVYKGTLSSGVEIAVVSTVLASSKDWSKHSEGRFRKKIDSLSRINHKNFINLLGYCEEEEPFMRMMVLEYAPNGTLYEHLHVEGFDHIDWNGRMRIIMGVAYCIQHMHELNPSVTHPGLQSSAILLSEDGAAKILDMSVWKDVISNEKMPKNDDIIEHNEPIPADPAGNVCSFGLLMLEIISGKPPYCEHKGSLVNMAMECIKDDRSISCLLDPTLKTHKENDLEIICELIQDCIQSDPKKRPSMREVATKLREVVAISPEAATPRLSPLWWAELEILSVEAT